MEHYLWGVGSLYKIYEMVPLASLPRPAHTRRPPRPARPRRVRAAPYLDQGADPAGDRGSVCASNEL